VNRISYSDSTATSRPHLFIGLKKIDIALYAVLALCLVRLWLMSLPTSFWVDEMGTVFIVRHGASAPSLRAAPQVAASIYYWLPRFAAYLFGTSEISYRLFSVLAMGAALYVMGALAARLIHPRMRWFAIFGCLVLREFNYQAADARPYALGTLTLALALLCLVRWLDSGRLRDGLLFAATGSLLWWVHLLFWPFYIVFAIYAVFRIATSRTSTTWLRALAVFSLITAACIPVALSALKILHEASSHVVVPRPLWSDLAAQLKWHTIAAVCAFVVLLNRYRKWDITWTPTTRASMLLIAAWWLVDPLAIFAFSTLSGNSVFVGRYMYLAIPGVALASALCVACFVPERLWKGMALILGLGVLVFGGHWKHLWPLHQNSGWRDAATALHQWTGNDAVPVITPSPFIEARPPVWKAGEPADGFLYSNLAVYPAGGHAYAFPFESYSEAEAYARSLAAGVLVHARRFAIYGGDANVRYWRQWFAARPEFETWQNRTLGKWGDVQIDVFCARGQPC
jgi:hypothetical protein